MTPSGIEYRLEISPYYVNVEYHNGNKIAFYFSSELGKRKFSQGLEENRQAIHESLTNRFRMKFKISPDFCDLQFYKRIERRGYLIIFNGVKMEWQGKLVYSGQKVEEQD